MHEYKLHNSTITIQKTPDIRKVYVELSSECNFDCEMCFRQTFDSVLGSMSGMLLERVQEQLAALPELQEVVIGGLGEPLLHPRFQDFIRFLRQRNIAVSITTNGALLEPQIDFLIQQKVNRLIVSFETGDIGHSNESDITRLLQKIGSRRKERHSSRPSLQLLMVLTKANLGDLERVSGFLQGSGVREIILSNLLPATPEHRDLVLYPFPEPDEIKSFKSKLLINVLIERMLCQTPNFEVYTERSCDFIENKSIVIRWDGMVAPCYRFLHAREEIVLEKRKRVQACSFGNIQDRDLLDIWNERQYTWFRYTVKNNRYPSCIDCSLREGCDYIESTESDCWGNEHSCADCLWSRGILKCP